jgi:hypothetical protein
MYYLQIGRVIVGQTDGMDASRKAFSFTFHFNTLLGWTGLTATVHYSRPAMNAIRVFP